MSVNTFTKRIYTIPRYIHDISSLFVHLDEMRDAFRSGRVSRQFSEKIMIAVTQVNGCRMCTYAHTKIALEAGLSENEIRALFKGSFEHVPEEELPALLFAQHYADTNATPDPEMLANLKTTYGEEKSRDIMAFIRQITLGNLMGNTLDAFLSRFRKGPKPPTNILNELGVFLAMIISIPLGFIYLLGVKLVSLFR